MIASPVYWYTLSTPVKRYLDHWSRWLRTPGLDFRATAAGRTLWGVTALAHEEREVADPLIGALNNSAAYLGCGSAAYCSATAAGPVTSCGTRTR